ncbi:MAG: Tetratricopeptide 2 repeat protein [Gammaproteobacteria bacterium]|nr:Tetratricopeptide 2 repeat protein [Gammaproteobacteria bacterium]
MQRIVFVLALFGMYPLSSNYAVAAIPVPHENPHQADSQQELSRLRNEGVAHFESGIGLKKALASFEAALKISPTSPVELFNLGATQRKLGDLDKATETLLEAADADKLLPHPYYTLGLIYRTRGDARQALTYFTSAHRIAPADPTCNYQLGRLYREAGRDGEALQAFVYTLQLNPSHTGALYQLHLYYQEHGQVERAQRTFEEFSRLKRAASASRRETNEDEGELSSPIAGVASDASAAGAAPEPLSFKAAPRPLAHDVTAFDVNDLDGDGLDDLVVGDRLGRVSILMNRGQGKFEVTQTGALPQHLPVSNLSLQIFARGEGFRVVAGSHAGVFMSDPDRTSAQFDFKQVSGKDASHGVAFADLDHDGDVDMVVGRFEEVLINQGNAQFRSSAYLDPAAGRSVSSGSDLLTFADLGGHDSIDAVVYTAAGRPRLLQDALGGKHVLEGGDSFGTGGGVIWSAAADVNGDGRIDLLTATAAGLVIHYNAGRLQFRASAPVAPFGQKPVGHAALAVADFDNDGRPDIIALNANGGGFVWRNLDGRRFETEPVDSALQPDIKAPLAISDVDNDGRLDLLVLTSSGDLSWLQNTSAHVGGLARLTLKGLRSAPSGLHAEVEVRRGTYYAKSVSSGRLLPIALGRENYAEVVRITWADGFVESKFKVDGGQHWTFPESERVSGSCPSVYAWNGQRFNFVTDAFISGPMGVPLRPGRYFPVDHDEYVRIPGELLRPDRGHLRIAVTEELREAVYLDSVKLLALDHPENTEAYPNEYLLPGEAPEFKLHVSAAAHPPPAAVDQSGADVLDLIARADQRYPANFRRLAYDGYAEPQGVEFTLPSGASAAANLRLLLTGWFYYFESSSLISAAQRTDLPMIWPQVQVWTHGHWLPVMPIGLPSGKDKTVVVDLAHKLPDDARRLRIWTNLALYWDRIAIDMSAPPADATHLQTAPLRTARLDFRGFSGLQRPKAGFPQPERFDYQRVHFSAPWDPLEGIYTRYGDVREPLRAQDSQFAVFGSGDEIMLDFDARALQRPPAGWKRDYLLYLNGYVKDGDRNTAHAGSVEPLPFSGMHQYPYSSDEARAAPWHTAAYRSYERKYQFRKPLRFTGVPLALAAPADAGASARPFDPNRGMQR